MLRDPYQRIISAYYHKNKQKGTRYWGVKGRYKKDIHNIHDFLKYTEGKSCQTKTVLGRGCVTKAPITEADVTKAIHILRTEFPFVGLTELYDTSICLFHQMHGGRVVPAEFLNIRPSKPVAPLKHWNTPRYNVAMLPQDWTDAPDARLYAAGKAIFFANLKKYGCPGGEANLGALFS